MVQLALTVKEADGLYLKTFHWRIWTKQCVSDDLLFKTQKGLYNTGTSPASLVFIYFFKKR